MLCTIQNKFFISLLYPLIIAFSWAAHADEPTAYKQFLLRDGTEVRIISDSTGLVAAPRDTTDQLSRALQDEPGTKAHPHRLEISTSRPAGKHLDELYTISYFLRDVLFPIYPNLSPGYWDAVLSYEDEKFRETVGKFRVVTLPRKATFFYPTKYYPIIPRKWFTGTRKTKLKSGLFSRFKFRNASSIWQHHLDDYIPLIVLELEAERTKLLDVGGSESALRKISRAWFDAHPDQGDIISVVIEYTISRRLFEISKQMMIIRNPKNDDIIILDKLAVPTLSVDKSDNTESKDTPKIIKARYFVFSDESEETITQR